MLVRTTLAVVTCLGLACGPEAADHADAEDPGVVFTAGESLCHDFCLNVLATGDGCSRAGQPTTTRLAIGRPSSGVHTNASSPGTGQRR